MPYLQCLSFLSRENSLNSHIKVYRFLTFLKFPLKNVFRKIKISQRRIKIATNFVRFLESSEHFLSPLPSLIFRTSKLHVEKFTCDVMTTSLWSHVPHLIHLISVCDRIENSDQTGTGPDWDHFDRNLTET